MFNRVWVKAIRPFLIKPQRVALLPAFSACPPSREVQLQLCVAPEGSCVRTELIGYIERERERDLLPAIGLHG